MNISTSVAIQSCHGVVELKRNGDWSPFPSKKVITGACEKELVVKQARFKRQVNSGKTERSLQFSPIVLALVFFFYFSFFFRKRVLFYHQQEGELN